MKKVLMGLCAATVLAVSGLGAMADSHVGKKGVNAFRACFGTATTGHIVGAPSLTLQLVVDSMPKKTATGSGKVSWGSVGPAFKPIDVEVSGPWYFMCTMTDCNIRYDFQSPPGAPGLKGSLVMDNWGSPGKATYEFQGGPGPVTQPMAVCN
jgi:hypothetical protein